MWCLRKRAGAAQLIVVVVVVLGFFASASTGAEPVCGELASNANAISNATWNNQFLGQRFEVTYAVMLSAVSIKIYSTSASSPLKAESYSLFFLTPF
jgi:hypothetical protein